MAYMTISFADEAYETFQGIVAGLSGYAVTLTKKSADPQDAGESFDAILIGSDHAAEDGATVKYIRVQDNEYDLRRYPLSAFESGVFDEIKVGYPKLQLTADGWRLTE